MELANISGHTNDIENGAYTLQHIEPKYIKSLKSKVRSLNSENAYLKEDLKDARKTVVVKKANKPPKVTEKEQWEAKIVADFSYVNKYSSDKSKHRESITITIITNYLEKAPSQSVFKSFLKQCLQETVIQPSSIDHRISRIKGLPDGMLKSNRKLTNIIFSYIQKYY